MRPIPEPEILLSDDGWLRRLARGLVADPNQADDLVQEAWLVALRRPESAIARGGGQARAFLAGVLRNLGRAGARSNARRGHHEGVAAREPARSSLAPETSELVSEIELRREVADRLLALEEPLRTVVSLRYLRDLSLKQIAEATGAPLSTVHARLERGLAKLRADLDDARGGDRAAWSLALLPFARAAGGTSAHALTAAATTTAIGAFAMTLGAKIGAAFVVAGCALGLYLVSDIEASHEEPERTAVVAPPREEDRPSTELALTEAGAGERVAAQETGAPIQKLAQAPPAVVELTVEARVVDTTQRPLPGVRVAVVPWEGNTVTRTSDADGLVQLPAVQRAIDAVQVMPSPASLLGGRIEVRGDAHTLVSVGLDAEQAILVVAEPRAEFAGIVVDAANGDALLEGAQVVVRVKQELYRELGLIGFSSPEQGAWKTTTGVDGAFRIDGACGGEKVFLDVSLPGYRSREIDLPRFGSTDLVIELERRDGAIDVVGRVVDERGAPVEGAHVSMGSSIVLTDRDGLFTLPWSAQEASGGPDFLEFEHRSLSSREPLRIGAVKPGLLPAWQELVESDLDEPLLLRLGPAPLTIRGRVVNEAGQPVEGALVWEIDPQPLGEETVRQGEFVSRRSKTVEGVLRGKPRWEEGTLSDEEGFFELDGLMDRDYTLRALHPQRRTEAPLATVAAGTTDLTLVLEARGGFARVAGRVVSISGAPIEGVEVTPESSDPYPSLFTQVPAARVFKARTDAEGRFDLGEIAVEGTNLRLFHERTFFRTIPLADFEDTARIEIVEPILCELQAVLADLSLGVDRLQFLDADGVPQQIIESFGVYVTMAQSAQVREGRTGVLKIPETARTVLLLAGEREVARRSLTLDPEKRTEVNL